MNFEIVQLQDGAYTVPTVLGGAIQKSGKEIFVIAENTNGGLSELGGLLTSRGALVQYINENQGIADIVHDLQNISPLGGFDAIHLVSHGGEGVVSLGRDKLTGENLDAFSEELCNLGSILGADGDLLIYGCNVGKGSDGASLVARLAALTGADVAASNNITGNKTETLNQDWQLEVASGDIDLDKSSYLNNLGWEGSLALPLLLPFAKVLGEAVVGAFAGYAVEQLLTTEDGKTTQKDIVLQFPKDKEGKSAEPVPTGIDPSKFVKEALFLDTNGDLVDVRLSGSGSFKLTLSGGLTNLADAISLELKDTDSSTNLSFSVSPIGQSINAGSVTSIDPATGMASISGLYNRMYSPGYTNLDRIFSGANSGKIGNIELTAAVVNNIDLPGYDINSIEVDTGYTTLVDRVNTTTLSSSSGITNSISGNTVSGNTSQDGEIIDFAIIDDNPIFNGGDGGGGFYRPVTGLIDLGNLTASSLERLIINGSISAATGDANDPSNTNDIRGFINISGRIGNIAAKRSRLDGTVQAASIGKIDIGRIDGTVITTDTTKALSLTLPANFAGSVSSAGHLNLAYTFYPVIGDPDLNDQPGPTIGSITSDGGISGISPRENDPIFVPSGYNGIVENTSQDKAIADIRVNGALSSRWISASDIGNVTANLITPDAVINAHGNIKSVRALRRVVVPRQAMDPANPPKEIDLAGTFIAGSIGDISSATGISADFLANKGSIGSISALSGGITSRLIEAAQDIGPISARIQELNSTKVIAQNGSIKGLKIFSGTWSGVMRAGRDIEDIYIEKGSLNQLSLLARGSVGNIEVRGANTIVGGTFTAGSTMGTITAKASRGTAIQGAIFKAGNENGQYADINEKDPNKRMKTSRIAGFNVESHGATLLPSVEAGMPANLKEVPAQPSEVAAHGMESVQIIAGSIGIIKAESTTGSGIVGLPFLAPLPPDGNIDPDDLGEGYSVIHAIVEDIDSITGIGNGHGLANVIAVAQRSIGSITGVSEVKGNGIENNRINANDGNIGPVEGRGGVAGGHGIHETFMKALGELSLLRGITNANEGDGIRALEARVGIFGNIEASVLGGKGGNSQNPKGSGIVQSYFKGYNDPARSVISYADSPDVTTPNPFYKRNGINGIKVDVRSVYGRGIDRSTFDVKGAIDLINSRSFGNQAIFDSEFSVALGDPVTPGDIKQVIAESINAGSAIESSKFISENGSIGSGRLGVTAKAGGLMPVDHGINSCQFEADINIGAIQAQTKGGVAINASSFIADNDFDNLGKIISIKAATDGENQSASAAIKDSEFVGAQIDRIEASVDDFDGGDGIEGSEFTARTATYDKATGAVNNRGTIGGIIVNNASRIGDGIAESKFFAGAAGSIGNITIDVISTKLKREQEFNQVASGRAVHLSEFRASSLDPDQTALTGTIGSINIKAGRVIPEVIPDLLLPPNRIPPNDQSSIEGSGINASYFAAYGGIGQISIESIGTGVFGSAFVGNGDPLNDVAGQVVNLLAQQRGPGRIAGIDIKSSGLYASGTLLSLFAGANIGNISVAANGFPIPDPTAFIRQIQNLGNLATALQSGAILPVIRATGQQLLDFLTTPVGISSSPVTLTAFVGLRDNIGTITFTNTSPYGSYPFLGSLVFARNSYGAVTTTPVAVKARADFLPESFLLSLGFTSPNVFTMYPLPTTFIGTRRAGGNLPAPLAK